jgi:hypothetical protein
VAVLASDHAWLWGRGYEGGGPQLELLRRLAHWMLKEPDLEEEILSAQPQDQALRITRRTLAAVPPGPVEITAPDGAVSQLPLPARGPGLYSATVPAPLVGLYRLKQGDLSTVVAVGPPAPREFEMTLASGAPLADYIARTGGGVLRIEDGLPDLRSVASGRVANGRGWIGITPREAYVAQDIRVAELLPAWVWLLLAAGFALVGWLREGRMGQRRA